MGVWSRDRPVDPGQHSGQQKHRRQQDQCTCVAPERYLTGVHPFHSLHVSDVTHGCACHADCVDRPPGAGLVYTGDCGLGGNGFGTKPNSICNTACNTAQSYTAVSGPPSFRCWAREWTQVGGGSCIPRGWHCLSALTDHLDKKSLRVRLLES